MERELSKFDCQSIIGFEFLDTPGDEVAPGSDEIGKDFQYKRLRHGGLLRLRAQTVPVFQSFNTFKDWENATTDSMVVGGRKSKGKFACHEAVS
jgi:hypothetical protein